MRGYKLMKSDMTCVWFQYEIGKEYSLKGKLEICRNGFHFCENPFDCLYYYNNIKGDMRLFIIEASGKVITEGNKSVTDKIKIIEEITDIEKFFDENIDNFMVNYYGLSSSQKLSEGFIEKHSDKINWRTLSACQKLSESFIEKHCDKVDWDYMSANQKLSEGFIEKHSDKVDWDNISQYQKLSESFIEKYCDKINWDLVSTYQTLSEDFIEKHSDNVNWEYISIYQTLSEEFRKKYNNHDKIS